MSANSIEDTGIPLPRISHVDTQTPSTLIVTWVDGKRAGQVDPIDISPIINTYKVFHTLRKNDALFESVRLVDDGDAVAWGDNEDLEISAEALEDLAEQSMTPQDFVAFMKRYDLTEEGAAANLGYSRRQIGYFKCSGPIRRVVALACKGYEALRKEQMTGHLSALIKGEMAAQSKSSPNIKIIAA